MGLDPDILAEYNATRDPADRHLFCHAPFTSLNFEQNGNVTVCCYNRSVVLGTYPNDTIADILQSPAAESFREQMKAGSPPVGCNICVHQLTSRNFQGLKARFYDGLADPVASAGVIRPRVMEFEISNTCNLECIMCDGYYSSSIRKNREHLPPLPNPYDDEFVNQLEAHIPHLKEARFLGGEPFLIKTYHKIWEKIATLNPQIEVSITTNGTVLTDPMKKLLERMRANIILSLDSLEPSNFERIRVNARFPEVMENLDYFEAYVRRKDTHITIALCVMQQNWRELPHYLSFCSERGFHLYCNTVLKPRRNTLRELCSSELEEIVETLGRESMPHDDSLSEVNRLAYLDIMNQIEGYRDENREWERIVSETDAECGEAVARLEEMNYPGTLAPESRDLAAATLESIVRLFVRQHRWDNTMSALDISMPGPCYFANAAIGQLLGELYSTHPSALSTPGLYYDILKTAASALQLEPTHPVQSDAPNSIAAKMDRMAELFSQHPLRESIMDDTTRGGTSIVISLFRDNSMPQLERIMNDLYPLP